MGSSQSSQTFTLHHLVQHRTFSSQGFSHKTFCATGVYVMEITVTGSMGNGVYILESNTGVYMMRITVTSSMGNGVDITEPNTGVYIVYISRF